MAENCRKKKNCFLLVITKTVELSSLDIDNYFEIVQKQSPWSLVETGTPTTLKAGDRFFMVVENNAPENIIGGFGVKERIESTDFVRNNLAVKYDWKTQEVRTQIRHEIMEKLYGNQ